MQLRVTTADGERKSIVLDGKLPLLIGRSGEAGLCLPDRKVSRRHAELTGNEDGDLFLEDLSSRTGTRVNGAVVSGRTKLRPGDVIRIGETELVLAEFFIMCMVNTQSIKEFIVLQT